MHLPVTCATVAHIGFGGLMQRKQSNQCWVKGQEGKFGFLAKRNTKTIPVGYEFV